MGYLSLSASGDGTATARCAAAGWGSDRRGGMPSSGPIGDTVPPRVWLLQPRLLVPSSKLHGRGVAVAGQAIGRGRHRHGCATWHGPCRIIIPTYGQTGARAMDIAELLAFSVKNKASDLHLSAGLPPMIRVDGDVRRINIPAFEHKQVHALIYDIMSDKQRRDYEEFFETDFSFEIPGLARFRVNAFTQNRGAGAVFRTIPSEVLTLEDLATPRIFRELIEQPQGLILVTGPTGSGKSTTHA